MLTIFKIRISDENPELITEIFINGREQENIGNYFSNLKNGMETLLEYFIKVDKMNNNELDNFVKECPENIIPYIIKTYISKNFNLSDEIISLMIDKIYSENFPFFINIYNKFNDNQIKQIIDKCNSFEIYEIFWLFNDLSNDIKKLFIKKCDRNFVFHIIIDLLIRDQIDNDLLDYICNTIDIEILINIYKSFKLDFIKNFILSKIKFNVIENNENQKECYICFEEKAKLRKLNCCPCLYCENCFEKWFIEHYFCCYCKKHIYNNNELK